MLDPNGDISGKGYHRLPEANIKVVLFDDGLKSEIEEMNRESIRQHRSKANDSIPAKRGRTFFVGRWRVGHGEATPGRFLITLNEKDSATKSNVPEANGSWEYDHGEARIIWSDGWKDIFRRTPEGVVKLAFRPNVAFGATPTNTSLAQKIT